MKKVQERLNVRHEQMDDWKIERANAELIKEVESLKVMIHCLRKQVRELQDFKGAIYTAAGVGIDLVVDYEDSDYIPSEGDKFNSPPLDIRPGNNNG